LSNLIYEKKILENKVENIEQELDKLSNSPIGNVKKLFFEIFKK
jgi:hypothetical protein